MTDVLIAFLDISDASLEYPIDDAVAEYAFAEIHNDEYADVWMLLLGPKLRDEILDRLCARLDIPSQNVRRHNRPLDVRQAALLFGAAVAHIGRHDTVTLYDCDDDTVVGKAGMEESDLIFGAFRENLVCLDDAHAGRKLGECDSLLGETLRITESAGESMFARRTRMAAVSLRSFLQAYLSLLSRMNKGGIYPTQSVGEAQALASVDFQENADELARIAENRIAEPLRSTDFVATAPAFFQYGARCFQSLRSQKAGFRREILSKVLNWCCVYFIAASIEAGNSARADTGLLYVFRSLEVFVLAYLWTYDRLRFGPRGRFLLDGQRFNFVDALEEFFAYAPTGLPRALRDGADELRHERNRNILVHGFQNASDETLRRLRSRVKGLVSQWDSHYVRGAGFQRSPLLPILNGERWAGDLGRNVALHMLGPSLSE